MCAGYLDIQIDGGASFNTSITLTDVNGNPLNLTNVIINSQAKKSFISANISANIAVSVANVSTGIVYLSMDALTTANLTCWPSKYYYDVIMTNTETNLSQRVLQGILYVNPSISYTPNPS